MKTLKIINALGQLCGSVCTAGVGICLAGIGIGAYKLGKGVNKIAEEVKDVDWNEILSKQKEQEDEVVAEQ